MEIRQLTDMLKNDPNSGQISQHTMRKLPRSYLERLHPDGVLDTARISLSADVCASCHGEPPRHGRFHNGKKFSRQF